MAFRKPQSIVALAICAALCMATVTQAATDCTEGLEELIDIVSKDDVTPEQCKSSREAKQQQLADCESDDGAKYVADTLLFVKHYGEGGECHGTKGPVDECHDIPKCYKIINGDDSKYDCGDDNVNAKNSLECFQEQIDHGCEDIGKKLLEFNKDAAEEFCDYEMDSAASSPALAMSVVLAIFVAAFL